MSSRPFDFMTPEEVSAYTRLSEGNLAQRRFRGQGPRYYKPTSKVILYDRRDIDEWLASSLREGQD